jgi:hypothetical protein
VLATGQAGMNDPGLGQVVGGQFHFVGNTGWSLFEQPTGPVAARPVTILRTPLN